MKALLLAAAVAGCAAPSASVRVGVGEEPVRTGTVSAPSPVSSQTLASRTMPKASRSRRPDPAHGTGSLNWTALAYCESSNTPTSVSRSGKYRGPYQFDLETWQSVGGVGDPAQASRAEQTYRAWLLYRARGRSPWPVCGSRL